MVDIHNHTKYSFDSKEEPENLINAAIKYGGKVLGISDHLNLTDLSNMNCVLEDVKTYCENIKKLSFDYKNQIKIVCGLEFNYFKGQDKKYKKVSQLNGLDYIINSVHYIGDTTFYKPGFFDSYSRKEIIDVYLDEVIKSLHVNYDFQILGHLGQISKLFPYDDKLIRYEDSPKKIDTILNFIIKNDICLECNTNYDGKTFFPHQSILRRYYELGGKFISLGSDAHIANKVYKYNKEAVTTLKEIGFKKLTYFSKKNKMFVEMENI